MQKRMVNAIYYCFIAVMLSGALCLNACSNHENNEKQRLQTFIVEKKSITTPLYFSGNVEALHKTPVNSPVDGVITQMNFNFGNEVKKGELLFVITSDKQKSTLQSALASYVQAKSKFLDSQNTLNENQPLYDKGLISRDEYNQSKEQYYLDQLALIQAKSSLEDALANSAISNPDSFFSLSLTDIPAINKALNLAGNTNQIKIYATADGLALFSDSTSSDDSNSSGSSKISEGSTVKQDQVLVNIGDLQGIALNIDVDEMDINQISVGQTATVTSSAFPGITLQGSVVSKDGQAQQTSDALPTFGVRVEVPHLNDEERKLIHVGMSAKVAILLQSPPQIIIPINAVNENGQLETVQAIDKNTHTIKTIPLETGQTTTDEVVITSGLNPGDEIVIPH